MLLINFLTMSIWLLTYSGNRLFNWKARSEYDCIKAHVPSSLLQKGHYFWMSPLWLAASQSTPIHTYPYLSHRKHGVGEMVELDFLLIKCKDTQTHVWEPRHVTMLVHTHIIPVPSREGQVDFRIWLGSLANHRVSGNSGEKKNQILSRGKKMKTLSRSLNSTYRSIHMHVHTGKHIHIHR